jgi:NADH-quinone oxidoreductase subunit N
VNSSDILTALTGFFPAVLPEVVLGIAACVLFLGGTWRTNRHLWGGVALVALALAFLLVAVPYAADRKVESLRQQIGQGVEGLSKLEEAGKAEKIAELRRDTDRLLTAPLGVPTIEARRAHLDAVRSLPGAEEEADTLAQGLNATLHASPVLSTRLALLIRLVALLGAAVLLLFSWNEVPASQAADYHACLLFVTAGVGLTAAANDLVVLFLTLELISIPTYVMLYLCRHLEGTAGEEAQEAAMKYFLLSVFSSALLLFGFSYLYGLGATTNLTALHGALAIGPETPLPGVAVMALLMVVAGLGFRITAVPFHFYAPDVYQGTSTGMAALLAFVPKVAGFVALIRVVGLASPAELTVPGPLLADHLPRILFILAAFTMSLGNVLALLQNNLKRLLAYSSVAHAGYMLVGLAAAPKLPVSAGAPVGGTGAVLFYLVAYGAMTVGAFAVLHYLTPTTEGGRPAEEVEDLGGLARTQPGVALLLALFLFSLIGIPLTAGFYGKFYVILAALGLPVGGAGPEAVQARELVWWFRGLALLAMLNAAVGAWYYLRIIAVMYLREPAETTARPRAWPVLTAIWACALITLGVGIYPTPVLDAVRAAVPQQSAAPPPGVARAE